MLEPIAYVYLLTAVLLWGTYLVPFRKMKADVAYSQFLICSGIMTITIVISLLPGVGFGVSLYGLLSGAIWGTGNYFSLLAVKEIGISRAFPVWISSMLIGYAWGVLLFAEITGPAILLGLAGAILVFAGAVTVTRTGSGGRKPLKKGILLAMAAAVLFGTQFVPFKLSGISPPEYYFQMSLGAFVIGLLIFAASRKVPSEYQLRNGLLSGVLWGAANFAGLFLIPFFGISRAGPLSQACVIVGVLWGLFYFREFRGRKAILRILAGTIVILGGVFLVGLA
jgi:glucose uptake protein